MNFNKTLILQNKKISIDTPTFVIAEAGVNHDGDMNVAKELIDLASDSGADAVKFQAFNANSLILDNVEKASYQKRTTNALEFQIDILRRLEITKEQNLELKRHCENRNIIFLTTAFDEGSLDELDELDLPAYKISSTDATNLPFLKKVAQKGKPIFLSTGMTYLSEVRMALKVIYEWNKDVVLLQCTSNYPVHDSEVNLSVINTYRKEFDILLGYSDHSIGVGAAPFAIPMGAKVIEKHLTLDKKRNGPDHTTSLSPKEFKEFVKTVRRVDKYMGSAVKQPILSELNTRKSLQKCMVASRSIRLGEYFNEDNTVAKRTGGIGISPINCEKLFCKRSSRDYKKDEIILID